jgi:hypothetical protein
MKKLKVHVKMPGPLYEKVLADLKRPHNFAGERVGFLYTTHKIIGGQMIIWINSYSTVTDDHYIYDRSVAARFSGAAIRDAMEQVITHKSGSIFVHLHDHKGVPAPSETDKQGIPGVVQSLVNANPTAPHGYLILSKNSFFVRLQLPGGSLVTAPECISVTGKPMVFHYPGKRLQKLGDKYSRQSFLGPDSQFLFGQVRVAIVGLGGGGSHVAQQFAHIGILNPVVFDGDHAEESNLNRLIGAWFTDIIRCTLKTRIAKRLFKKILPGVIVECYDGRWQDYAEAIQTCDIVVGCVDDYASRAELEAECRRYLIPYIDIGMDVHADETGKSCISGQVITSIPGWSCMRCLQFVTEEKLGKEAAKYGQAGIRPQVVWPNGTLASAAVGIVVELITGWTSQGIGNNYLCYDGNKGTLVPSHRLKFLPEETCDHFPLSQSGVPAYQSL